LLAANGGATSAVNGVSGNASASEGWVQGVYE